MSRTTIEDIHQSLNRGDKSVTDWTNEFLSKIKKSNHNAFLHTAEERARDQAKKMDEILSKEKKVPVDRYPLFGIPLGIKDVLTMDGVPTTCASKILEGYRPPYTATCVERLENAGAISLGKLNMDEFAMGSSNENSAYGNVKHPTHPDRVPGGSSGGSACAVKADLCVGALGSDTGGSIRLPANYCGIVGFKPSYGRISRYGLIAYASSLDQVGPMTHTVEDAAKLFEVMAGADERDSTCAPRPSEKWSTSLKTPIDLKGVKIGVPKEYFVGGLDSEVAEKIQASLQWYESQGAKLVELNLPHTKYAVATYYVAAVSEASSNLARFDGVRFGPRPPGVDNAENLPQFYKKVRSQFGAEVKRRIILGTFALSSGYYDAYYMRACKVRRLIRRDFDEAFKKVDVIASPVSPTTAFKAGEKVSDPLQMYLVDIFTIPVNLAGLPALSIPCGEDRAGLPVGLHLIGQSFKEDVLLKVAHRFEQR